MIIMSVISDGTKCHITMFKELGGHVRDISNLQPVSPHPTEDSVKVCALLDVAHMLKHSRNTSCTYLVIKNGKGEAIKWEYIQVLH